MPNEYFHDKLEVDMVIGRPLFYNYYTVFNMDFNKVGFY